MYKKLLSEEEKYEIITKRRNCEKNKNISFLLEVSSILSLFYWRRKYDLNNMILNIVIVIIILIFSFLKNYN
jgi:RsiW-degrading membrane proteinase PrsW (M82 family)